MKHIVFLGDGMADYPLDELGGKTPLDVAKHPNMDKIAQNGLMGLTFTIPKGMPKGSDVANLSIFGVDPNEYYTGRSPLEAISLGIKLSKKDVTYRLNLVTLSDDEGLFNKTMLDYSAGEISSEEASELINVLQDKFGSDVIEFYAGVSYRHCLVLRDAEDGCVSTPPHDISDRKLTHAFIPANTNSDLLLEIMNYSIKVFKNHPINLHRIAMGKNPATSAWFWGEGRKPNLLSFKELYGISGGVISAVDLLHGIGLAMGLISVPVENITGNFHTDFAAKGRAAIRALQTDCDFLYIHVEAPDECGHQGQSKEKVWSIEQIDQHIIGPVLDYLENSGEDWSVLVTPDHATPLALKTHTDDAVPFAIWHKGQNNQSTLSYNESNAAKTKLVVPKAHDLMSYLIKKDALESFLNNNIFA